MTTTTALSALLQKATIEDHEELLKECNAALKQSKSNPEVLLIKIIALIKLDRYEDALKVFQDHSDILDKRAPFEKAYALYKLGRLKEARSIAKDSSNDRGLKHVLAQAVRFLVAVWTAIADLPSRTAQRILRMRLSYTRP